jgi:hypothetical protein
MRFELAVAADEPALRRLLREAALAGAVSVTLEREPCIHFGNAIEGESNQILVARSEVDESIVAMGTRTLLKCYVNGMRQAMGYLGQLRLHPRCRSNPTILRRGYETLRCLHEDGAAAFYVTTIISDNERARRVLEAGLPGLPTYQYMGEVLTLVLSTIRRIQPLRSAYGPTDARIDTARIDDLDDIVDCLDRNGRRYQLTPCWTRVDLLSETRSRGLRIEDFIVARRGDRLIACIACWDQREFKQTVVRGYSRSLNWARPLVNCLSPLTGIPKLPAVGQAFAYAYLSHLAVDDDDPGVFEALVRAALQAARKRGLRHVLLGLGERSALTPIALERFKTRQYRSRAYLAHWLDGREAVRAVDSRPLHLEVAIL